MTWGIPDDPVAIAMAIILMSFFFGLMFYDLFFKK